MGKSTDGTVENQVEPDFFHNSLANAKCVLCGTHLIRR